MVAPPGAGKTTLLPLALLDQPWLNGAVWLLSPRRLAARAAAERMAQLTGTQVGGRIGYAHRLDKRVSADTQLTVMTHGLFRNRLLADPELTGVAAVIFDEVHERSLDSDFALALAVDAQQGLRPDLRLIAMSATLDGARFSAVLGGAPVLESKGASHPLTIRYLGRRADQLMDAAMVTAVRRALDSGHGGDILAFLPGVRDIDRTAQAVAAARLPLAVTPLHGQTSVEAQQRALAPASDGARKLILATSIAETSLTIPGVRIVIDSGLARRPRIDRDVGISRLVTERASQAAVTQRAGRAAREGPGLVLRLWEEAATSGLPPFDPPEVHESDLMPVVLDCASWGIIDPRQLAWLDPPTPAAVDDAKARLAAIGAIGRDGRILPAGRELAGVPLPVPLAHMLIRAAALGDAARAARLAVLLTEPGLGGRNPDLEARLAQWGHARGQRDEAAWALARGLTALAQAMMPAGQTPDTAPLSVGALVALAWPDRVARARSGQRGSFLSVSGRAFVIDPADPLAGQLWLAIADAQGQAAGARILAGAALSEAEVEQLFAGQIEDQQRSRYDQTADRVDHERRRHLGAITLTRGRVSAADMGAGDDIQVRMDAVRERGLSLIGWGPASRALRQRAGFAGLEALGSDALIERRDQWLMPLLARCRGLRDLDDRALEQALMGLLDWDTRQRLDRLAPARFTTPLGSQLAIDYAAEAGPTVMVRVQEMFGLNQHPHVGEPPVPLVLALTSPAGRPIQTTRDLPGFWSGSWRDVQREMKGRYPKHPWPDDPAATPPTRRTKAADARSRRD